MTSNRRTVQEDRDARSGGRQRGHGEGALYWSEERQRWVGEVTVGYRPDGKRIVRKGRGKTKAEAQRKLKEMLRDHEDGLTLSADASKYTVAEAAEDWLSHGLRRQSEKTRANYETLIRRHIIPDLGARKLRELTAKDVDRWLHKKSETYSTRTLRLLKSTLRRVVTRAQAEERVRRNVVELVETPEGQEGRRSKSFTLTQAQALLEASKSSSLNAYIVTSLLTGARTEEMRTLLWTHVDLIGDPDASPPVPPHIMVWRSVRAKGETKTKKSRRSLALPALAVEVLRQHGEEQNVWRGKTGRDWTDEDLVFCSDADGPLDAANVRREFRNVTRRAGLDPKLWVPRELRHSFVSLLSDSGVSTEQIAQLVGHSSTSVTETVYRHQIRPVIRHGADVLDGLFRAPER